MKTDDLVSVIIVNWNGRDWLQACLESIKSQTYPSIEIILVDNASTDGSLDFVRRHHPEASVVECEENLGYAGGNNRGICEAKGKYVFLLNNDTKSEPDVVEKMVEAFDKIPLLGSVNPRITLMGSPDLLDNTGSFWTSTTYLYHYGFGQDRNSPEYDKAFPVFYNNGAAMIIRRELIETVGALDEDFWCYNEEGDFCQRLWIAGYECWYYPESTVAHAKGASSSRFENPYVQFHAHKNRLMSYVKNFEAWTLVKVLPVYLAVNFTLSAYWLLKGETGLAAAFYKALWWNLIHIRGTLRKRASVQSFRCKLDKDIFSIVKNNPSIGYYYRFIASSFSGITLRRT